MLVKVGINTNMKKLMTFGLLGGVSFLFGCTTTIIPVGNYDHVGRNDQIREVVPVEHVEVLYKEPARSYESLALMTVDSVTIFATIPGVIQKCRKKAAMLGADAFIVTSAHEALLGKPATVSGQAIKWK